MAFFRPPDDKADVKSDSKPSNQDQLKGLRFLEQYPKAELYRLVVDGWQHKLKSWDLNFIDSQKIAPGSTDEKEAGWMTYEGNERNSLQAVFDAFAFAIDNFEKPITVDLFQNIHRICSTRVYRGGCTDRPLTKTPGEFHDSGSIVGESFGSTHNGISISSESGVAELIQLMHTNENFKTMSLHAKNAWVMNIQEKLVLGESNPKKKTNTNTSIDQLLSQKESLISIAQRIIQLSEGVIFRIISPELNKEQKAALLQSLIKEYYSNITKAQSDDEKLTVIVSFIKKCELLHPFPDANTRTNTIVLLNLLLMQNNLQLATFENPNFMYLLSTQECVSKVKEAQANTEKLIKDKKLFDFDTATMKPKWQALHATWTEGLLAALQRKLAPNQSVTPPSQPKI